MMTALSGVHEISSIIFIFKIKLVKTSLLSAIVNKLCKSKLSNLSIISELLTS